MHIARFLILGLIFASAALAQSRPDRVDGPGVKVGDSWMYNKLDGWNGALESVSVNTIREISADGIFLESASLDGSHISRILRTRDFNLVRIEAPGFTQTTLPYYPNFVFPLQIGKTWRRAVEFASTAQPGKKVRAELEGRVIGWDSVTVPAGNFLALKIELKGWYSASTTFADGDWSGRIEDALWYAPEVRNAVRYEYRDTAGDGWPYNHEIHELVRYWLVP